MIFQKRNLFLTSILLSLSILLTACGGGNHDIPPNVSAKSPETLQSAPESTELILNGPRSNYLLTNSGDEFIVSDKTGKEGTISARGKTSIKFTDVSINLLVEKKSKTIAEKDLNTLVELYVAFFNRVPDADGMSYWIDQIKAGMTVDQLANNFYNAAIQFTEVTHYAANMTSADFVKIIYKNVLGRTGETAPSNEEVNYWASELDSGRFSKGRLVVTMLHSAHTFAGDAKWGWVPQLLDNKVSVGKYFAIEQGLNFNTPQESITQGVAIAAAISPTDVSKAKEQIPAPDKNFSLSKSISSIVLNPNYAYIDQGKTQAYQLVGIYSDGSTQVLSSANWSSSSPSVADVSVSGIAKGIAPGTTNISVTYGSKSASASLVVSAAKLSSITLSSTSVTIAAGATQNLTATGFYADGTSAVLSANTQWTSSNSSVATVSNAGAVKGVAPGKAKISVTNGSVSAAIDVAVTPTLQSITISPSNATIAIGFSQQFTATAIYSDGTSAVVTPVWTSNNSSAASINSSGLANSSMRVGATTIVATLSGISASANLTITDAVITSIKLSTPYEKSFPLGVTQSLTANATMSDGWSKDVTNTVVWTSSNKAVATVTGGVVTPLSVGTTNISATANGQTASYSFVVNAAVLTGVRIGGPDAGSYSDQPNNFAQGSSRKLRLDVYFSDGTSFLAVAGTWVSSDTSKVTVNNSGVFSAVAPGTVTLSASFGGLTAKRNITIATPVSTPSILITCNTASPMSISAATWNAAYASDPTNLTKWLDVDWASCNSRVGVKLVDVKSNYLMFEAVTSTNNVFSPGEVYSTGRTPQLTAGDVIRVGYSNSLGWSYYTLYSITVKP